MNLTSGEKQVPEYSFDDWAKSLFVLNLWLPNVASGAKLQFLYTLLESSSTQLPSSNEIKTYEEFEQFAESLLELVPDFGLFEDYVPEPDWGEIKYFFRGRFFKIFYGGEVESSVDHYYAFEILHSGFDDYYREHLASSALDDLEMCLSVQHAILDSIEHPSNDIERISPGHIEIPPHEFWSRCIDFLDSYSPIGDFEPETVLRFTKNIDADAPIKMPKPNDFENRLHTGENCFYFFIKRGDKIYPVMPRRFLSVLFDTWGTNLKDHFPTIEKTVKHYELRVPTEFVRFVRERIKPENLFDFAYALYPDEKPHSMMFAIALAAQDKLLLFHIPISFLAPRGGGRPLGDELADHFAAAKELLSRVPLKLGLARLGKTVQLDPAEEKVTLSPLLIACVPTPTVSSEGFSVPNDFDGQLMRLTELVGIIDEVEDAEELGRFFDFKNAMREEGGLISPFNSDLDLFGSFRDSHNVLVAGAINPTFIALDPHWGSNFRYKSLKEFWAVYPKDAFLENPRAWKVASVDSSGGAVVLESRTFFAYYRLIRVDKAELFIQTPAEYLTREQGGLTETFMDSLADSFGVYRENIENLAFASEPGSVLIIFFPMSLVAGNSHFEHLLHLVPTNELWKMDIKRLKSTQKGVRIVFNDTAVAERLIDATDRSLQVELFVDVLGELNQSVPDNDFAAVSAHLEAEKSKPNRFRRFARDKRISFPEFTRHITAELRDFKLADKEIAKIANATGVAPGDYEGSNAKEKIAVLIDELVRIVEAKVFEFNIAEAIPAFITNVDSLTHELEAEEARTKNSLDQEVDYVREIESGKRKSEYLHVLHEHQYLIEKFVQLQPSGDGLLTQDAMSQLLALVERLLHLYTVSDHIHYDIFPSTLQISHDFIARAQHVEDIGERMEEWGKEQAQIKLGMIGTDDRISIGVDMATYMAELDEAFHIDLGFSFNDLIALPIMLYSWAHDDEAAEHTFYSATVDEIASACEKGIEGFDLSTISKILDFLTLPPDKVLMLEGATEPTNDLPVWEHRKRSNRYGLRPLIMIGDRYYWGPHSVERSSKIWASMTNTHKLPSDIQVPAVAKLIEGYHQKYRIALQTKIKEIVRRVTSLIDIEVSPSSRGFSDEDIGDIDVFALTSDRKILLNIESKVIDQAFSNKDMNRVSQKIFGRTTSKGGFEKGYLQRVEARAEFLKVSGKKLAESIWVKVAQDVRVVSIFVTPTSFWWTKFPPVETDVNFVELSLLEDFFRSLKS
ncbi:MAG TPA: hypothetical protein VGN86_09270 [Pyrinomonadaceae bacterium]|jgi:hypothetical protein|nr:hypothetical protein [Pyrinomonadaceae bacterium]